MSGPVFVLAAWDRVAPALGFEPGLGRLLGRCALSPRPGETRLMALAREAGEWAAGLDSAALAPERKGVFFSCSKGGMEAFGASSSEPRRQDPRVGARHASPLHADPGGRGSLQAELGPWLWSYLSSSPGEAVRDHLGWRGGGSNTPLACATGAYAIGLAAEAIRDGRLDLGLAGAAEASLTPLMLAAFGRLGALSQASSPAAFRGPFDRSRDGFAMAEGAGALLLGNARAAQALGLKPLARLAAWACNSDAHHPTAPLPGGGQAAACLRAALAKAGLQPEHLAYVNAHGTGTPSGDEAEVAALKAVFGPGPLPRVSGIKGAIGHALGAAGAIEAVATVRALAAGRIPAHAACADPMPEIAAKLALEEEPMQGSLAASLSMGFGGHNVALVLGKA